MKVKMLSTYVYGGKKEKTATRGTVVDVDADEAARLVDGGHAVKADAEVVQKADEPSVQAQGGSAATVTTSSASTSAGSAGDAAAQGGAQGTLA